MLTRREFGVAAAAGAVLLPGLAAAPAALYRPPSKVRKGTLVKGRKIRVAAVGCGGKGASDIGGCAKTEEIVALCDVDEAKAASTFAKYPDLPRFKDYREMLSKLDDRIDAVIVATPDHMHFPAALLAIQMGKHVYVQKPLAHTIREMRILREAARFHEVKAQMGNQGQSGEGTRLCKEWIEAGVIGSVSHIDIWTNRPIWPQGCAGLLPEEPVPQTLDWNLWQGVAAVRPYNPGYVPFKWRGWWEYGCGAIGDMGCHSMNAPYWALDLAVPSRVELVWTDGTGNEFSPPKSSIVKFHFPARGGLRPCTLTWYEGRKKPPMPKELEEGRDLGPAGALLYGDKGILHAQGDYCDSVRLIPEAAMEKLAKPPKTLRRVKGGHYQDWFAAIRGDIDQASSNFDHAAPLAELGALGNLAIRTGRSFEWNSALMAASDPAAQKFIDKHYRRF